LPSNNLTKRLRVFAGPNGSGKSTIVNAIRQYRIKGRALDFGVYVNADDIAKALENNTFSLEEYELAQLSRKEFMAISLHSGLIRGAFTEAEFKTSFSLNTDGVFKLKKEQWCEHLAQVMATVLREKLLEQQKKMSFETVFSHPSKLDFMRRAKTNGYKVYLYFVATEDPELNITRIKEVRVVNGGHDVPEEKIRQRYQRSLDLLFDAAALAYQVFFFDNSKDRSENDQNIDHFAHFKVVKGQQVWDPIQPELLPAWFARSYLSKV
jgi:predicted ABC-type ATPase